MPPVRRRFSVGLFLLAVAAGVIAPLGAQSTSYTFQTLAGRPERGSQNGPIATAAYNRPRAIAFDENGVAFIADTDNHTIRRIGPDGTVSTYIGQSGSSNCANGLGSAVRLSSPRSLVTETGGVLYFGDNCGIRKVAPDGTVTTVTNFGAVAGLLIDGAGSMYFTASHRIWKMPLATGVATVFAGTGSPGYVDGAGNVARFNTPTGLTRDAAGNLYTTDSLNWVVRRISPDGTVATISQLPQHATDKSSGALGIGINGTTSVLYVANTITSEIVSIAADGTLALVAGTSQVTGSTDGTGTAARFNAPAGLGVDSSGNIFVTDTGNSILRKVTPAGVVTTYSGIAGGAGYVDGTRTAARFNELRGIAVNSAGDVFIADYKNCVIRKSTAAGVVSTFAGTPPSGGTAFCGSTDGTGTAAKFNFPSGLAVDASGTLYVADTTNSTIRKITSGGVVTTFAGSPLSDGSTDATGTAARFSRPQSVAVDGDGNVFVADTANATIRKITSAGVVTTFAGTAGQSGTADGTGAAARFMTPTGVAVDTSGNLYVADFGAHTIRKITPAGVVTTFAGAPNQAGTLDGTGTSARFNAPTQLATDSSGNVFVAVAGGHIVRSITPAGVVTTLGGSPVSADYADGVGLAARFNGPFGIAVHSSGNLYVADTMNHSVRVGLAAAAVSPSFEQHPANTTVNPGGTATFTVSATGNLTPAIQWQVSTDKGVTWTDLTNSAPYSGVTTSTLTITNAARTLDSYRYRAVATNLSGSAMSNAATLTVVQIKAAPSNLKFAAVKANASAELSSTTPAQTVTVSFAGATGGAWTASTNVTWLQLSATSGSGNGQFTVSVVNPGNVIGGSTSLAGAITVTAGNTTLGTATVAVTLTVSPSGATAPIGQMDTPAQGATGVVGAIGVTGWVIDDIGIRHVKIYRNCLAAEPQVNCQSGLISGASVVYVGDAILVNGARPDVEAAFPTYPAGNLAGWGLHVLTNMLPRMTGTYAAFGGQGPITFYALAEDVDGNRTVLGRAYTGDHTPTSITMDNDNIAKPFGNIDTPGQGATVSGTVPNFGWALTPDSNLTADGSDILIPTNGSTSFVFINGSPVAPVNYNQCRGSVGNPVPGGAYCNDDVSNIFGNPTPQASGTARLTNPTRYRNLDAARGPIGSYVIDTATLGNGLHTIAWSVTDSANRTEGLGSRFFSVLNSGARPAPSATASRGPASMLEAMRVSADAIVGRAGFDLSTPYEIVGRGESGVASVVIPASGRLELRVGPVSAGYLVANGELRALPPGSQLDAASGTFTWAPGPGFLGTYRLAFVGNGEQVPVDVTLRDTAAAAASEIRMHLDSPAGNKASRGPVTVAGWALDPQSWNGSGIAAVHVWARRIDMPGMPEFVGVAELGVARPDVAAVHGAQFGAAGFSLTATLGEGTWEVTVFAWNARTRRFEDARSGLVTVR